MFQQQTPFLVAINIILILLLFFITKPALANRELTKFQRFLVILISFAFCVFSFWGADWFHYYDEFYLIKSSGVVGSNMEKVYYWIIERCPSYLVFRIVIWGLALFFFIRTLKLLKINIDLLLFFFCSIYLIWFSYARVSLAMSLMIYGSTLIITNETKSILKFLAGLFFIAVSFYFHKSSPFGIATILFVMLIQRGAKTSTIIAIVLYPVIIFLFNQYLGAGLGMLMADESSTLGEYAAKGNYYLEGESGIRGLGIQVISLFEKTPYYLMAYLCVTELLSNQQLTKTSRYFYFLTIVFVFISSIFLFDIGVNGRVTYVRFLRYTQIPATISFAYMFGNNRYPKLYRFTYILGIVGCFVNLLYVYYCS